MRVHHLNCGCMCPIGGALIDGVSRGPTALLSCHCLLVETDRGLVLVDTGFGTRDIESPSRRFSPLFRQLLGVRLNHRLTALHQIRALGYSRSDVRHIVLTHLDFDHAGGIEDFPNATVHVMQAERDAAQRQQGLTGRGRYSQRQWDGVRHWRTYQSDGERWLGFEAVRNLDGLPPEILMIPLPGHTWGHAGIAINTKQGWLLHAGDAYFFRHEVHRPERHCPPGLRALQQVMCVDPGLLTANRDRLRGLASPGGSGVRVFCSHDAVEFEALRRMAYPRSMAG